MSDEVVTRLRRAVDASKCHDCGCYHEAIAALRQVADPVDLCTVVAEGATVAVEVRYQCKACDPCWPADALTAAEPFLLSGREPACPSTPVRPRESWPPLAGAYRIARFTAPIAVCTLHSDELVPPIAAAEPSGMSIVGSLATENLGIERIVTNVTANPNIRRLLVCGNDATRTVGHFPGQALLALASGGTDERQRIIGAVGRRPFLRNTSAAAVDRFRHQIEVIDHREVVDVDSICALVEEHASAAPGPTTSLFRGDSVAVIKANPAGELIFDPSGYVVIFVDRPRGELLAEHYQNSGVLDLIVRGTSASAVMGELLARSAISRLDHAAYLGRELTVAEQALESGEDYQQDRAPGALRPAVPATRGCCARGSADGEAPPEQ